MTTEKKKAYLKEYYKKNKKKFADYKKIAYWRNKARNLGESEASIKDLFIEELKELCSQHLN